jgi:hypothetical protein
MGRTACTEPQCLYKGALYITGALAKLRKATIAFVIPFCLSIRMEQLSFHWKCFLEFWYEYFATVCGENPSSIKISQ